MKSDTKVFVLCGLGGVGKTSIALEASWQLKKEDPAPSIFWLTSDVYHEGENSHKLDDSIKRLAAKLKLNNPDVEHADLLSDYFESLNDKFLVVIDNLDQEKFSPTAKKLLKENWLQNGNAKLLITTRLNSSAFEIFYKETFKISALKVDCLSDEEGGKMIEDLVGLKSPTEEAKAISEELGGLTLALKHFAEILTVFFDKDFKRFLKEIQKNKLKMLDMDPFLEKKHVKKALMAPVYMLAKSHPQTIFVLRTLTNWPDRQFNQEDFEEYFSQNKIYKKDQMDELKIKEIFSELRNCHIIEKSSKDSYTIHGLILEIVLNEIPREEQCCFELLGKLIYFNGEFKKNKICFSQLNIAEQKLVPWSIRFLYDFLDEDRSKENIPQKICRKSINQSVKREFGDLFELKTKSNLFRRKDERTLQLEKCVEKSQKRLTKDHLDTLIVISYGFKKFPNLLSKNFDESVSNVMKELRKLPLN
jgi:hypothetical protein